MSVTATGALPPLRACLSLDFSVFKFSDSVGLLARKVWGLSYQMSASESWITNVFWTENKEVAISLGSETEKHCGRAGTGGPTETVRGPQGPGWSSQLRAWSGPRYRRCLHGGHGREWEEAICRAEVPSLKQGVVVSPALFTSGTHKPLSSPSQTHLKRPLQHMGP